MLKTTLPLQIADIRTQPPTALRVSGTPRNQVQKIVYKTNMQSLSTYTRTMELNTWLKFQRKVEEERGRRYLVVNQIHHIYRVHTYS